MEAAADVLPDHITAAVQTLKLCLKGKALAWWLDNYGMAVINDLNVFDTHPEEEGINLPVSDYMALMKKRLKLIKKMVMDEKKRQQQLQVVQERRNHPTVEAMKAMKRET